MLHKTVIVLAITAALTGGLTADALAIVGLGLRRVDPCLSASKTHFDVQAVVCVRIRYKRWDSAAVSLEGQRRQ